MKYSIVLFCTLILFSCEEASTNLPEVAVEEVKTETKVEVATLLALSELDNLSNDRQEKLDTGFGMVGTEKSFYKSIDSLLTEMNTLILAEDSGFSKNIESWELNRTILVEKINTKLDSVDLKFGFVPEVDELTISIGKTELVEKRIVELADAYPHLFKK